MAVPTGSGTETLHAHHFADCDGDQNIIQGIQHHVYTVMSIIVHCNALNAVADYFFVRLYAHDGHAGASSALCQIVRANIQVGETYVWNDKFSFNGYEPSGTNVFSDAEQVAIAAQGGSQMQYLVFTVTHASDDMDVTITYLDQDWT